MRSAREVDRESPPPKRKASQGSSPRRDFSREESSHFRRVANEAERLSRRDRAREDSEERYESYDRRRSKEQDDFAHQHGSRLQSNKESRDRDYDRRR